ncbi:hypothetical protein NWI01_29260 [Nitrobacter winogradskyi]|uniref:Uncharacterized protein n=1 Tax=Nitrobacter winogradskyi TaxID=913 RepID=A0A4Y3WDS4_NITWI|nr:hypothetical protein NWI01_29260 [Nitrobacter winogradskyi]
MREITHVCIQLMADAYTVRDLSRSREIGIIGPGTQKREPASFDSPYGEKDIVENGKSIEQKRVLVSSCDADTGPHMLFEIRDVTSKKSNGSSSRRIVTADDIEKRRFTSAVRPQNDATLTLRHDEIDT